MDYLTRRPMSEALRTTRLSDEALTFLAGLAPKELRSQPPAVTGEPPIGTAIETHKGTSRANPQPTVQHPNSMEPKPPHISVVVPAVVSVTFRLPASLSARLCSTSAERKLRRERPFSQQDIVAEALNQWLTRHSGST